MISSLRKVGVWRILLTILACADPNVCAASDERQPSLGPLRRFDPVNFPIYGLTKIHGNPRLGLAAKAGERMQQVGDAARWCVEAGQSLEVIEWNPKTKSFEAKEVIQVTAEWCLDPAGEKLMASRYSEETRKISVECFDFNTGVSLWTCEKGIEVADVVFSPDGKQVILFHTMASNEEGKKAAVSWLDAVTGDRIRQVVLEGEFGIRTSGLRSNYIGMTSKKVYVSVCRKSNIPEVWSIANDEDHAVLCSIDKSISRHPAQIEIGGKKRDLVAIYNRNVLELFRENSTGELERISRTDVSLTAHRSVPQLARFSPDGAELFYSDCEKSIFLPTGGMRNAKARRLEGGISEGDFNPKGTHIMSVDDGGMVLHDRETLERVDHAGMREAPIHCCPIEEAGFSLDGEWIISNDRFRLILWSRKGELIAELASPNEGEAFAVEMQSPLVMDNGKKIVAADGWQFLEWDLSQVLARKRSRPGFYIRVVGKPIYTDQKVSGKKSKHMTLSLDSTGEKLITATGDLVIYRDLAKSGEETKLNVPKREISMRPREFFFDENEGSFYARAGGSAFELDPAGKKDPNVLTTWLSGFDPRTQFSFLKKGMPGKAVIICRPLGAVGKQDVEIELPSEWSSHFFGEMLPSPDSKWIVTPHGNSSEISAIAVIDREKKALIRNVPLPCMVTSIEFSRDGRQLAVGASNRCVYVFDVSQLVSSE